MWAGGKAAIAPSHFTLPAVMLLVLLCACSLTSFASREGMAGIVPAEVNDDDIVEARDEGPGRGARLGNSTNVSAALDGKITPGEYDFMADLGGGELLLYWNFSGGLISMAMVAKTTGWIAMGFDPSVLMRDADMIIGYVTDSGETRVLDCYSTGDYGPHPADTDIGGTDDIKEFGGSESGGSTTLEFTRPLSTGDTKDKPLPKDGSVKIIWAIGDSDDLGEQHPTRGTAIVDLVSGNTTDIKIPKLWPYHATSMSAGLVLMIMGMVIARFLKGKAWWFKAHRAIAVSGAVLSIVGILLAFYMVSQTTGQHFRVPHAFLGAAAILAMATTPVLGFLQFKIKPEAIGKIKMAHRWAGRIAIILFVLNILSGLFLVRII